MNFLRLLVTASLALTCLPFVSPAEAKPKANNNSITDCSSAVSMIVAPDGTCYNLSYLTWVGATRTNLSAARGLYKQALDLTASTGTATTYTYNVGRGKSISNTYSDNPTEEEKQARQQFLQDSSKNLEEQAKVTGDIESTAFRLQLYVLNRLSGTLAGSKR